MTAAAAVLLLVDRPDLAAGRPFQAATGGIGLSSATSAEWSFFTMDPRTESVCENELWPIPGLSCPNPFHGTTVIDLPPLEQPVD